MTWLSAVAQDTYLYTYRLTYYCTYIPPDEREEVWNSFDLIWFDLADSVIDSVIDIRLARAAK